MILKNKIVKKIEEKILRKKNERDMENHHQKLRLLKHWNKG